MTDKANKKDVLKKHVRALLLSSPVALTVHELKKDFHDFIGEPIDHKSMGYTTIEDFFRDIDDAVHIGWKNGMMTLTAKADETTKHIEALVSKQKVSNKKKYAVYRNRGGGGGQRGPPRSYSGYQSSMPPRYNQRTSRPGMPQPPSRHVPAYVRNQIRELFKSFPDGLPITQLDSAFFHLYGSRIEYVKFGFYNGTEFLQSLKDIVKFEENSNGEMQILPLGYLKRAEARIIPAGLESKNDDDYYVTNPGPDKTVVMSASSDGTSRPSKGRGRRRAESGDSNGNEARSPGSSGSKGSNHKDGSSSLELEIQQVLEKKKEGIWARRLPFEYTAQHGKELDFQDHGYFSVIDFISSMPSIVRIERPSPQGDWMLYDARIPKPQEEEVNNNSRQRRTSGRAIETETKESIQKILEAHPCGILLNDFPDIYKKYLNSSLPVIELGFNGPEELFLSLADSILQLVYTRNGGCMLFAMDVDLTNLDEGSDSRSCDTVPMTTSSEYPDDAVGPGCHFTPVMCPEVEQYVGLYVSNIINPGIFWVILRHKKHSLAMEALMDDIAEAYSCASSEKYRMPESLMVPGQVCATLFPEDNNWHRGVITGTNEAGFIEVYFVDYGNTTYVQRSTLRFLKTEFLTLPVQAIQARLANIHPPTGKWKVKSRNRMLELTKEKPLVAYVTDVKTQVMSICLTDTSDPQFDLHINDVLVKEGHAMFQPDNQLPDQLHITQEHAEVPDYGHVFGWNSTKAPRLPHAATMDNTQTDGQCYVKWIQLTQDHVIHLINIDRVAYVISAEISSLLWEEDILISMLTMSHSDKLNQKRMPVNKLLVSSDKYPHLFHDLTKYNVKSLKADLLGKGQFLSLYPLSSVPEILQVFEYGDTDLISAITELGTKFDPDSPYWKSSSQEPAPSVEDEDDDELGTDLSQEGKQMALQALQFKRKRILQSLMSNPAQAEQTVNELNNCEIEITMLKKELENSQGIGALSPEKTLQSSVTSPHRGTNPSGITDNDRAIQNIMASTTKPIATANIMTKATTSLPSTRCTVNTTDQSTPQYQTQSTPQYQTQSTPQYQTQSTTGTGSSFPGMMGVGNMFSQQQAFNVMNPLLMTQTDMMSAGIPDMSAMMGTNLGMMQNFNAGLLPQLNPLLAQQFQKQTSANTEMGLPNHMGDSLPPTFGRGQPLQPGNLGILPGLLPLFHNLNFGRGRGANQ